MKEKKLVVLKLDGSLQQGVRVYLEISTEGDRSTIENVANLPPAEKLIQTFRHWHTSYRQALNLKSTGIKSRIKPKSNIPTNVRIENLKTRCQNSASTLHQSLNQWLKTDSFRSICNVCLKELNPLEEIKIIIRTSNHELRKLPWQEWDLWQDYPQIEFVLSAPQAKTKKRNTRKQARILVILGDKREINVEQDQQYLQKLCQTAEIVILDEPTRTELDKYLWDKQGWDLLFFSGHSQTEDSQGRIFLNSHENDSLTMKELRYGLQTAVEKGLQLAIFNSCDGLGIATELEQLHIPHIIVMKEPVPDKIAQEFLKYFLEEFTSGDSVEKSVETSRRKLQSWEKEYPCASWLPVLVQNPLVKSPTWQSLNLGRISPYRGLAPFREEDAIYFFGRERLIEQLSASVNQQSLVAVIGASGSGKSSLIFAGLIPRLRQDNNCHWQIVSCRPTNNPFQSLATALINYLNSGVKPVCEQNKSSLNNDERRFRELELETNLRSDSQALRQFIEEKIIIKQDLSNYTPNNFLPQKVLLVVDQFEELYTLCDRQERQLFLDSLLEAINWTPMFTLILTLRADFYESILSYRPLSDALQNRIQNIAPMNKEELVEVINKPAQINQVGLEKGLTETLIKSVINESGNLPLLEFTLTQLWEQQTEQGLTYKVYEKIGGVEKALANHAELFYAQLTKEERETVKSIFIQLVLVPLGEDFSITRRIATKTEIKAENWQLVTKLANARLVVTNRNEVTGIETVEVIHEALITAWGRLNQWLVENKAFLQWKQQLRSALQQWENTSKDKGALLRGKSLAEAEGWLKEKTKDITEIEQQFIQASSLLTNQERRRIISWLSGGLVTACVLSGFAFFQWQQSQMNERESRINEIKALNSSSSSLFESGNVFDSLLTSLKAGKKIKDISELDLETKINVTIGLQKALYEAKEYNRLEYEQLSSTGIEFSPDGEIISSTANNGIIRLWTKEGQLLHTLKDYSSEILSVAFSQDNQLIAAGGRDGKAMLWNRQGKFLATLNTQTEAVLKVAFNSNSQTIATQDADGNIKLWNRQGKLIQNIKPYQDSLYQFTFNPNGKLIATIGKDNLSENISVKVWNLQGELLQTLDIENSSVLIDKKDILMFSPKGDKLAVAINDTVFETNTIVKVWDIGGKLLHTIKGSKNENFSIAFNPDGKLLIASRSENTATFEDTTIKLWNQQGKVIYRLSGHSGKVNNISFSPTGIIASTDNQGTLRFWSQEGKLLDTIDNEIFVVNAFSPNGQKFVTLKSDDKSIFIRLWNTKNSPKYNLQHQQTPAKIVFNPQSQIIATVDGDIVKLWNYQGQLLQKIFPDNKEISSLAFSQDGEMIASGGEDGEIKIWDLQGKLLHQLSIDQSPIRQIIFHPDGKKLIYLSTSPDLVTIWNLEELSNIVLSTRDTSNLAVSNDGQFIATVSGGMNNSGGKLWNWQGKLLHTLPHKEIYLNSVAFSPNSQILATGGSQETKLWNLQGQLLNKFIGSGETMSKIVFSPNGKHLASLGENANVNLWNLQGELLHTLSYHSGFLWNIAFSPDNTIVASSGEDGKINLWSTQGKLLYTLFQKDIIGMVFSPDGTILALDSYNGIVKLWVLDINRLMKDGCDYIRDYLTSNNVTEDYQQVCDGTF